MTYSVTQRYTTLVRLMQDIVCVAQIELEVVTAREYRLYSHPAIFFEGRVNAILPDKSLSKSGQYKPLRIQHCYQIVYIHNKG